MKKLTSLLAAVIVSVTLGLAAQDETFYPYSYARLSYVKGDVYVQRTDDLGYEKGEVNLALVQGDKLGTERGMAEIHFGRRNYLRLDENTRIEFALLPREGEEFVKIHLLEGRAYLRVSQLVEDKGIELHTPDASFYVLEEGLFRFDVRIGRVTEAFVHEGSLEAASEDGSVLVRSLESVSASNGRLLGNPDYFYSRGDEFDDWNRSRDSLLARRTDRRYLPRELDAYEEELDGHGNWVYERPYGYVWVPVITDTLWRPYFYGRWVWYPVIGWTWVSSEPWGWAVYHYGRWHWRIGLGWYWIPHHHWRPAWVHWWWSGDYVGWCPLGWYNRPIVVINNYFYDRHFDSLFPAHNRALTVIRRSSLQAPNVHRYHVADAELGRISKVALKAQQPSIRPVTNTAGPQAVAARRVLAARPGEPAGLKNIPASRSLPSSRVAPRSEPAQSREPARVTAPSAPVIRRGGDAEGAAARSGSEAVRSPERAIRSYPSRESSGAREQSGVSERRPPIMRGAEAGAGLGAKEAPARVTPPVTRAPSTPSGKDSGAPAQKVKQNEGGSSGAAIKKGETIKNYPSTSDRASHSSAQSPSASFSSAVRRTASQSSRSPNAYPSRLSPGNPSGSRQAPAVSGRTAGTGGSAISRTPSAARPSTARMSSPAPRTPSAPASVSRPSAGGSNAPSRPSGSFSSPSRSSGSSGGASRGSSSIVSSSRGSSSGSSSRPSSSAASRSSSGSSGSVRKKGS